ncbi:uncharacterized protein LOC127122156 [Lathyrus oleraceus]|uniref:uncharacterized protein LOC127122156 n=1 Tax=Pisum sativum TaxID=3888 RepID=UPI0021D28B53|nr:uncharacterized protein LOC127122156 [Pisum sativum]
MSQPSILTPRKHTKEQSNPKNVGTEIDLFDVITDVVPLLMVPGHATPIKKTITYASRKDKPSKVSTSSSPSMAARNVKILEPSTVVKKPHSMTNLYLDAINVEPNVDRDDVDKTICVLVSQVLEFEPKIVVPDVSTSLAQPDYTTETPLDKFDVNVHTLSPEKLKDKEEANGMSGDLDDKEENFVEKKGQSADIMNIEDMYSDDVPIGQRMAPEIAKRTSVGPTKRWSKVITPVSKRKEVSSKFSEFDHDVEHNVQDIVSIDQKQTYGKIPANIPQVPIDNISFHSMENVEKWKFVYKRRLPLEREMGKDSFECKEVMSLIQEDGLMKNLIGFGKCYEMLVKEFIVNISKECDNKRSKEFRKVYVRGRCVGFSPEIINRFLGRNEEEQAEVEVSENVIYKEITTKQVKEWPRKRKLSASDLSAKYDILYRIGAANSVPTNHTYNISTGLGKFIYIVETKSSFDFGSYIFDQTMKHVAFFAVKMPIAFLSFIRGFILGQHPNIVMTSSQKSSMPTTRTCILADLKDTCKTLDDSIKSYTERKSRLEILIKALSKEEGNLKGDRTCEEDANEEGIHASDDEETTSNDED